MTQEEIQEYNKRCAEFLGWYKVINTQPFIEIFSKNEIEWLSEYRSYRTYTGKYQFSIKLCKFHSDWNWIMEVVERIQTLDRLGGIVEIKQARCKITSCMAGDNSIYADVSNYFKYGIKGQKEAVVQAINQFLIFYNDKSN
jgi:hypothetical protein